MDIEVTVEPELGSTMVFRAKGPAFCSMFNAEAKHQDLWFIQNIEVMCVPGRAFTF